MRETRESLVGATHFFSNRNNLPTKYPKTTQKFNSDVSLSDTTFPIFETLGEAADQNRLSQLQLEAALHACSSHSKFLPAIAANTPALAALGRGPRLGFFCGDGAGVGKGRTIAAVILDSMVFWEDVFSFLAHRKGKKQTNSFSFSFLSLSLSFFEKLQARGRKRHIWVSTSTDLMHEARRDLAAVGFSSDFLVSFCCCLLLFFFPLSCFSLVCVFLSSSSASSTDS